MKEDSIDKRRLTEKNLYERVEKNLVVRRNPLKKQKEVKDKVKLSTAEYTFLQFHYIIWKWATTNNNITNPELNILLYIFPLISFSLKDFQNSQKELGNNSPNIFFSLRDKGFIVKWGAIGRKTYYVLSTKAVSLINRMHKMYMLEEPIPTSPRRNVIARKRDKKSEQLVEIFKKFNNRINQNDNR